MLFFNPSNLEVGNHKTTVHNQGFTKVLKRKIVMADNWKQKTNHSIHQFSIKTTNITNSKDTITDNELAKVAASISNILTTRGAATQLYYLA